MIIRRFQDSDAKAVSDLIRYTLRISNAEDYPADLIDNLMIRHTPDYIMERAAHTHFYVAEEEGKILGCGAIGPYWDKEDESCLFTVFVLPEYQGKGTGRAIIERLEADEYALRADRIEIHASITGLSFYRGLGYDFKDGMKEPDEDLLYHLEKCRNPEKMSRLERQILHHRADSDADEMDPFVAAYGSRDETGSFTLCKSLENATIKHRKENDTAESDRRRD